MNWTVLIPLIFRYGPAIVQFVQTNGPAIAQAIKDIEETLQAANVGVAVPTPVTVTTPSNPAMMQNSGPAGKWSS